MTEEIGIGAFDRQARAEGFDRLPEAAEPRGEVFRCRCHIGRSPQVGGRCLDRRSHRFERRPDATDPVGRVAREKIGLGIEKRRPGEPGRHVVFRAPLGLQGVGVERGHHMKAATVVVERLAEGGEPIAEATDAAADVGRGVAGHGEGIDRLPQCCQAGKHLFGRESGRIAHHLGEPLEGAVDAGRLRLRELLAERLPGGDQLLEGPQESCPTDGIVSGPEHELTPGDVGLPELLDLGIDPLGPELPALLRRLRAAAVEIDEALAERLRVGHVGGGGVLQPHSPLGRVGKQFEAEELPQFLMLCSQERNILPGGRPNEPVEEEFVGMPLRQRLPGHDGKLRLLDMADRLDVPACEGVQRHDPTILEDGDRSPRGEGGREPRRRRGGACRDGRGSPDGNQRRCEERAEACEGRDSERGHRAPRGRLARAFPGALRRSRRLPGRAAAWSPSGPGGTGVEASSPSSSCRRGRKK